MTVVEKIRETIATISMERSKRRYTEGYDYAAGMLLRGEKTVATLDMEAGGYDLDEFDEGITAAITDAIRRGLADDDRLHDHRAPATVRLESLGLTPEESLHAVDNIGVAYGEEAILQLTNGRHIHVPAFPQECDYVRVTKSGFELAYWSSDEWRDDPECVMGAIIGCAMG